MAVQTHEQYILDKIQIARAAYEIIVSNSYYYRGAKAGYNNVADVAQALSDMADALQASVKTLDVLGEPEKVKAELADVFELLPDYDRIKSAAREKLGGVEYRTDALVNARRHYDLLVGNSHVNFRREEVPTTAENFKNMVSALAVSEENLSALSRTRTPAYIVSKIEKAIGQDVSLQAHFKELKAKLSPAELDLKAQPRSGILAPLWDLLAKIRLSRGYLVDPRYAPEKVGSVPAVVAEKAV